MGLELEASRFNRKTWKQFVAIAKPFWTSEVRLKAFLLLGVLISLSLLVNWVNAQMSYAANYYMTALTERREKEFYKYLILYVCGFLAATPIAVFYRYSEEHLGRFWRRWLTQRLITRYLSGFAYYRINAEKTIDNPDQRIADEVRSFTGTSLSFLLILFNAIISLFFFLKVLWAISITLTFTVVGYALFGSLVTMLVGRKLINLDYQQLKKEADLRYGLIHVRENCESIAFYRGEDKEGGQVRQRLRDTLANFNFIISWHRNLGFFTNIYNYLSALLPVIVVGPLYLDGKVEFGVVIQAGIACGFVLGALSLVVTQFERLSAFTACVVRLGSIWAELSRFEEEVQDPNLPVIQIENGDRLAFDNLTVYTANRSRLLLKDFSFSLDDGHSLLIMGPNGAGKSTLFRAMAGIIKSGSGRIIRPPLFDLIFLPQRPYMMLGSLKNQLRYSLKLDRDILEEDLIAVLKDVKLEDLRERIGGFEAEVDWQHILSLDEQQRVAFARLLLAKPRIALLDEATTAIDAEGEEYLYQLLRKVTKNYISVSPRQGLMRYHSHIMEFQGNGKWEVRPSSLYIEGI